jgi:hypothetical protein
MQATYSTSDMARLMRAEHERAVREAYYAKLERGGASFVERTVETFQHSRALAAAGLAAAAIIAGVFGAIH